jgi:aspartate racemase
MRQEYAMKTIGLLGGMSWESSVEYYRLINEAMKMRLGGLHSAKSVMCSVDFAQIETFQHENRWDDAAVLLATAAQNVERAGADCLVICTNTMHKVADTIQQNIDIPLLHIADATAEQIRKQGVGTVGLLGTRFTMEEDFYKGRLTARYGLRVLVPGPDDRALVHRVIYDELCLGTINDHSRAQYAGVMDRLVRSGAEGIILGCTEIGLLVSAHDSTVPLFDTTRIHAEAAVAWALQS